MAIRIIEGRIGSGKTYYAVWHVIKNYFQWNSDIDNYQSKDKENPVVVYSNIERFTVANSLNDAIQSAGGLSNFFNKDFQKEFCRDKKVLYIIDESQGPDFFHRKYYNPEVFFFFQYHRHFGCDIYLLTQDINSLSKELRNLAETIIKAVQRSFTMVGEFKYKYMTGGYDDECYKTKALKPEKQIFALYKSMEQKEIERIPSASRRYALIFILLIAIAFLIFQYGFIGLWRPAVVSASITKKTNKENKVAGLLPVFDTKKEIEVKKDDKVSYNDIVNKKLRETIEDKEGGVDRQERERMIEVQGFITSDIDKENPIYLISENGVTRSMKASEMNILCRCRAVYHIVKGNYRF